MPQQHTPPIFRQDGDKFTATPICRACAERAGLTAKNLHPYPTARRCEVVKCDGSAAFLSIDC